MSAESDLCASLVGSELYSVVFVRDYVQFYLDSDPGQPVRPGWQMIVNLYTLPAIIVSALTLEARDVGWADALRGLINHRVVDAEIIPNARLVLRFDGNLEVRVSLRPEDKVVEAVEVMHGADFWEY